MTHLYGTAYATLEAKEIRSMKQKYAKTMPEAASPARLFFVSTECITNQMAKLYERVSCRSYELYEKRGRKPGRELEDWLQAESELLSVFPAEMNDFGNQLIVRAEVRGFAMEKLEVGVEPRVVLVKAEKPQPEGATTPRSGYTAIHLSSEVDPTNVSTALKDGILVLTLTKTSSEKGRSERENPVGTGGIAAGSD
jgi:HSP20 family molecular chaperone IbpA